MSEETRNRFLAAIAAQLPADRIVEAHLFAPIRQGGMESGVAVVVVDPVLLPAEDGGEESAYEEPAKHASRYTVYTARYRHTLKGLDRGKWEASVTDEADAPLLTVDAVVRGVTRRSGDAEESVRLSGDELRATLPAPSAIAQPLVAP